MSQPYVGEIRIVGFNFAPVNWFQCNGQLLPISEFSTLFQLIGTTYGGDGESNFALPNLQGRIPFHQGSGFIMGEVAGDETVTLTANQLPSHAHTAMGSGSGNLASPKGAFWSTDPQGNTAAYNEAGGSAMASGALLPAGGNQPHDNMPPFLVANFIISAFGIFPSQG